MRDTSTRFSVVRRRYINGEGPDVSAGNPADSAKLVQIAIHDYNGIIVRTITMGKSPAGDGSPSWDGNDGNFPVLPAGIYSFSVNMVDPCDSFSG